MESLSQFPRISGFVKTDSYTKIVEPALAKGKTATILYGKCYKQ